jgi:intracellular multiplication protein IcmL
MSSQDTQPPSRTELHPDIQTGLHPELQAETHSLQDEPAQPSEPSEELKEHNKFSSDRLGHLLLVCILLAGTTLLFLILLISLQSLRSPNPLFFKASQSGQLIEEIPLDQQGMSVNILFNWLVEGMINAHSFNFVNYASKLELAREYFTTEGYDSFTRALQDSQILDRVINKKYVFRALPTAAPQIIKEGVLANHYLWKIKLPMHFQYRNVSESLFDLADLTLLVVRVPTTQSAYGIKILRYELILRKGGYS